jgi:hypothetical protein
MDSPRLTGALLRQHPCLEASALRCHVKKLAKKAILHSLSSARAAPDLHQGFSFAAGAKWFDKRARYGCISILWRGMPAMR